jgi:23S rRNA (cytosine1962-C5)-methyltransferase
MSKARVVNVTSGAAAALRRGHPWIWRAGVTKTSGPLATGDVVEVRGPEALGQAIWDDASPIAARMYTRTSSPKLDAVLIVSGIERAIERRASLVATPDTTAYRLCHGEGDRVPGVVIDRYDHVAVLRLDGEAIARWLPELVPPLWRLLDPMGLRSLALRADPSSDAARPSARVKKTGEGKLDALFGDPPPDTITVRENGVAMVVDLAHGQKTGAFLDQRDNRARVRAMAAGRRVLNLFSYAGGFSTAASLGGAAHVTSVDVVHAAHQAAQLSMRANGVDPGAHAFVTADAFAFLAGAAAKKQSWDLVVSDPPSFAPSEKAKVRALAAYRKLHGACAAVLAPGGIFCAASCSSHVTAEDFVATLDDVSLGRTDLSLVDLFGPGEDHPTVPAFPEGRYLKFAILR